MTFLDGEIAGPMSLRIGAMELACPEARRFESGSRVRIGLRPEEIRVRNLDSATPNQVAARIAALNFHGAFCRAQLEPEAAPGIPIFADFSANLMRDLAVTQGQRLTIALPPESLRVFAKG
jgi:iron(III) transport system ATP-binding protein